jgi:predicted porin
MTLLGVGSGAGGLAGNTTTLGRIGTGFMYADWKSQVAYTSPNWNGFSFTAGVTQSWDPTAVGFNGVGNFERGGSQPAYEGKVSYEWAGDVGGKVWASGITQNVEIADDRANAWDIGATINLAGFGLTGYYGQGEGTGTAVLFNGGYDAAGNSRDSKDWYVQGTYTLPGVGTKLGVSYGESKLEYNSVDAATDDYKNTMWTVGAYHPLTKHLNLVAEYSQQKLKDDGDFNGKAKTIALGAILFF